MREMVISLFLCGDVMLGRGVDQVLSHSNDPTLHEPWVRSARTYVELAEERHGPIDAPVADDYVWGDALPILREVAPVARILNLETAVTTHDDHDPAKGIHYRMHPSNVGVLTAAGIDCAVVANNHVLDWGPEGLRQTLGVLDDAGIAAPGAGRGVAEARVPASLALPGGGHLRVFAYATASSGVPGSWAVGPGRPGVNLLPDLSEDTASIVAEEIRRGHDDEDIVVLSLHWGDNWGFEIPADHRRFARAMIERAGVDLIHGHSSHHPRGVEVHRGRLILYGCGDFLNDYEGIEGHERYRPDLALMFLPTLQRHGGSVWELRMVPLRRERFRLRRADEADTDWLLRRLDDHSLGIHFESDERGWIVGRSAP